VPKKQQNVNQTPTKLNFNKATDQTEHDDDNPPSPDMDQAMQE
jgi:hypothetical protein